MRDCGYNRSRSSAWKLILAIILCLPFLLWGSLRVYYSIQFGRTVSGHLKRAADANTIELAKEELAGVVVYLEKENLTSGYTSVWYTTPNEDIGFWYKNLNASLGELNKVKSDATQLEKTNVLIKLRETLLDHGQSVTVTEPLGISIYPNNVGYFWFCIIASTLVIIGIFMFFWWLNDKDLL